jgi:hypothetical protein
VTRAESIQALTALTVDISEVMDLLPHAAPLGADEKVRAQGRMLRLKTSLDQSAGWPVYAAPAECRRGGAPAHQPDIVDFRSGSEMVQCPV